MSSSFAGDPSRLVARSKRYSYSSTALGALERTRELYYLYELTRRDPVEIVDETIRKVRTCQERLVEHTGVRLSGLRVLDIGPGQQLGQLRTLSVENEVTGIDTDAIPRGLDVRGYLEMLRHNTVVRTLKTVVRKALGVDRAFEATLARRLGVDEFPAFSVERISATRMSFPAESFQAVVSWSVFEHIDDPRAALAEVARVLAPGGVAYISVHQFTSHSGIHDPVMLRHPHPVAPYWPHLRPSLAQTVRPGSFLNEIRLSEWKQMFEAAMPGVSWVSEVQDELRPALAELRSQGELSAYTDDDLLTVNLVALWRKPS